MNTQPQGEKLPSIKIAMLGGDLSGEQSIDRDLPQVMGVIAKAARAAKAGLEKVGFGDIEIWPPGKFPLMGVESLSLGMAALDAVEPPEMRRCPIVKKIIDNAIAYHARLYWQQQAREEHAQRVKVWKERAA
jgi:hypothetical protein